MIKEKIFTLQNLSQKLKKNKKKRIVLCHGVFDLLHVGHIKHLNKAKKLGDILVVTITSDKFVNKGPGRPVFNQYLRAEVISALESVDYVAINDTQTAIKPIRLLKPNIYCKGKDYKNSKDDVSGEITNELKELKKAKGEIFFTDELTFSSSKLINKSTDFFSNFQKKIINKVNKTSNFKEIKKKIDDFKNLKVLLIGETIIDQYNFCEAIGKSGKEPILVLKEISQDQYLGGVLSIANNLSQFIKKVTLVTMLGEKGEFFNYVKKNLEKNIKSKFIFKKNSPTIVKKRFVDSVSQSKVIGSYNLNDEILDEKNEKKLVNILNKEIKRHDLVIVSDYGHGFISKKIASTICKKANFLALNAQVNASNIGYHTIANYKNFNTLVINEKEIRHEMRDKNSKTEILMKKISLEKNIHNLIVTKGKEGSIMYQKSKNRFYYSAAFAHKVLDKVGAGDTMLSLVAPCLKMKIDSEITLLIGSLAAAQSVETIGNKYNIDKLKMIKTLESFLK